MGDIKYTRTCERCGETFITYRKIKRFCTKMCRNKRSYFTSEPSITKHISPSDVGAIAELMVSCDLIRKGYDVYRALSPHSDGDLVAIKDDAFLKIEVRTGRYAHTGKLHFPVRQTKGKSIVIVTHCDSKIHYLTDHFLNDDQNIDRSHVLMPAQKMAPRIKPTINNISAHAT